MNSTDSYDEHLVLTVSEVASLLKLQRSKVYLFIEERILDAFKLGAEWRIKTKSVMQILPSLQTQSETGTTL